MKKLIFVTMMVVGIIVMSGCEKENVSTNEEIPHTIVEHCEEENHIEETYITENYWGMTPGKEVNDELEYNSQSNVYFGRP